MKIVKWSAFILLILIIIYFLGPKPSSPKYSRDLPTMPSDAALLEKYVRDHEALFKLKPDNEARIIWYNDSTKEKTEYAVVYLHGFSASQEEGDPVHLDFAQKTGCNLFLSRLDDHGVNTQEPLLNFTAEGVWNSAKEAYSIGRQLGRKVILMGTSTGATLALKLAAEYPEVAALILLSPNIAINDANAWLLNNPWGLQIARLVKGRYNHASDTSALYAKYWNYQYRMEATVQLEELLETTMKESTFQKIKQPILVLYYFKDEKHQDPVVKVSAMKRMFTQIATEEGKKKMVAIPGAGDHVIGSYIKSKDVPSVQKECEKFVTEILQLHTAGH
ncbi:MAG: alpha/beta hydrolase [Chitinophagaceae bacterium]|nr:alpha/beta hydrolase [Chitinophagaceae bacterium]